MYCDDPTFSVLLYSIQICFSTANDKNPEWLDGLNRRFSFAVLLRNLKLLEGSRFTRLKMYSNVVKSRFKRAGNSTVGFSPKRLFPIINLCQTASDRIC
jgi:hypothetical protein